MDAQPAESRHSVQKHLVFVRHGESVYNAHIRDFGTDPLIRDAPLNEKGRAQAADAEPRLRELLEVLPPARVVVSPLRRALETALLARPTAAGHMDVWPELREVISGCDDIGSTASELQTCELAMRACGPNATCLAELDEIWWTVPAELASSALTADTALETYRAHEELFEDTDEQGLPERLEAIVRKLAAVQEETIVVVAHCDLIGNLTERLGLRDRKKWGWWLRNAEVRLARRIELLLR